MTEAPEIQQTPEEARAAARLLLLRSRELRQLADDLTEHGEALLKLARGKNAKRP
ncbi:MAG TPA: hypothetical protein VGM54_18135 [Chthoniobacter sp.]|jgi:hypothetical protein